MNGNVFLEKRGLHQRIIGGKEVFREGERLVLSGKQTINIRHLVVSNTQE
jgi:hypothetical protein